MPLAVNPRREALLKKACELPLRPGVYIMKDVRGRVIYVGKSKKLRNRVSQYFMNGDKTAKNARMVSLVNDFDYILCDTEIEALALENTLIKKHSPRYNIKLKDGKPAWGSECTQCMACICYCPVSAIEYGKATIGKDRYLCPKA